MYSRRFSSGNAEIHGRSGPGRRITPFMWKGTMPIHDVPSNSWIRSAGGTSGRSTEEGIGQCANSRSRHD